MKQSVKVLAVCLFLGSFTLAVAQKTGSGGTVVEKSKAPKPKPAEEPKQKTGASVIYVPRYIEKPVTPTTGRLFVVAETGAVILVEPLSIRNAQAQKGTVPEGERGLIFNDLKPGTYRLAATLTGFHEIEKSDVVIKRNESQTVTLRFEQILFSVAVHTNVDGELKYGGREGEIPNSISVQNQRVTLRLPAGDYFAEFQPAGSVYQKERRDFSVAGDMVLDIRVKLAEFSKETFRAEWTEPELKNWEAPAGWQTSSGSLIIKGAGVALPRADTRRLYKDFQLTGDVKVTNGLGIGFALRAQDTRNYYLVEFTGAQADEPFYVRLWVIKNGVEQRVQAIKIPKDPAVGLRNGKLVSAHLVVSDNHIDVTIEDNESGIVYPLGGLTDPNRTFAAGAPGVGARGNADGSVYRFFVCSENCPRT